MAFLVGFFGKLAGIHGTWQGVLVGVLFFDHPGIVSNFPLGALAHLQLGRAYKLAGDVGKARESYAAFLVAWLNADPDTEAGESGVRKTGVATDAINEFLRRSTSSELRNVLGPARRPALGTVID